MTSAHTARRMLTLPLLVLGIGFTACGGDDGRDDTGDDGGAAGPFELVASPEFVNMVIPGRRPVALVSATSCEAGPVELTATASVDGATVELLPASIEPGEVAEIWIELPQLDQETPFLVTVDANRGSETRSLTLDATGMPGTDDLEPMALDIAAVFLDELGGTVDALPATTDGLTDGTPVGGLLVVSHYAWFTDAAEIGLAWHVMVAPDDWAELTIRPRSELAPTQAFRLSSWSTALGGGDVEIVEIAPPPQVTR